MLNADLTCSCGSSPVHARGKCERCYVRARNWRLRANEAAQLDGWSERALNAEAFTRLCSILKCEPLELARYYLERQLDYVSRKSKRF